MLAVRTAARGLHVRPRPAPRPVPAAHHPLDPAGDARRRVRRPARRDRRRDLRGLDGRRDAPGVRAERRPRVAHALGGLAVHRAGVAVADTCGSTTHGAELGLYRGERIDALERLASAFEPGEPVPRRPSLRERSRHDAAAERVRRATAEGLLRGRPLDRGRLPAAAAGPHAAGQRPLRERDGARGRPAAAAARLHRVRDPRAGRAAARQARRGVDLVPLDRAGERARPPLDVRRWTPGTSRASTKARAWTRCAPCRCARRTARSGSRPWAGARTRSRSKGTTAGTAPCRRGSGSTCRRTSTATATRISPSARPGEDPGAVAGSVDVRYGSQTGLTDDGTLLRLPPAAGDRFGSALAWGDLNRRRVRGPRGRRPGRRTDAGVAAGAVASTTARRIGLPSQPSRMCAASLPAAGDEFGAAVAIGRFQARSADALAVGAPGDDDLLGVDAGRCTLLGAPRRSSSPRRAPGCPTPPRASDRFGAVLASGDLGRTAPMEALAVGAPGEDGGAGAAFVLYTTADYARPGGRHEDAAPRRGAAGSAERRRRVRVRARRRPARGARGRRARRRGPRRCARRLRRARAHRPERRDRRRRPAAHAGVRGRGPRGGRPLRRERAPTAPPASLAVGAPGEDGDAGLVHRAVGGTSAAASARHAGDGAGFGASLVSSRLSPPRRGARDRRAGATGRGAGAAVFVGGAAMGSRARERCPARPSRATASGGSGEARAAARGDRAGRRAPAARASTLTLDAAGASRRSRPSRRGQRRRDHARGLRPHDYLIRDAAGIAVSDARCERATPTEVALPPPRAGCAPPRSRSATATTASTASPDATVDGGPGDDQLTGWYGNDRLTGGPGDDLIHGSMGDDVSDGGGATTRSMTGSTTIRRRRLRRRAARRAGQRRPRLQRELLGGRSEGRRRFHAGDHTLDGGPGDDELITTLGDDDLIGGDGHDVVFYDRGTRSTRLAISGVYESGVRRARRARDETDRINLDIEELRGGAGRDVMIGSAATTC